MSAEVKRKLLFGFALMSVILILLAYYTYHTNRNSLLTSKKIARTNEVLYHSEQVLGIAKDIETGQRGFCMTNNALFLEPMINASKKINHHMNDLEKLVHENTQQLSQIDSLRHFIQQKLAFSDKMVTLKNEGKKADMDSLLLSMEGKRAMDHIRHTIKGLQTEQKAYLLQIIKANKDGVREFNLIYIALVATFIVTLLLLFFVIGSNFKALRNASSEIHDLYNNVAYGFSTIDNKRRIVEINDTQLQWLGYTRDEVIGQNYLNIMTPERPEELQEYSKKFLKDGWLYGLEFNMTCKDGSLFPVVINSIMVKDKNGNFYQSRTTVLDNREGKIAERKIRQLNTELKENIRRLETANKELEAFSYSVSHDLRAPLRSIVGYTTILEMEHSKNLDSEVRRIMHIINNNASKMGHLIDDLLSFSHLGKKELLKNNIDMKHMVEAVATDVLSEGAPGKVELTISEIGSAKVDAGLMKQVWTNLLSNAVKYSGKRDKAEIEVGLKNINGEDVYYVKDNGVGFDMKYAHKLFGVFQRLHKSHEFDGTGVGLAIVQRVIQKHGGRVWAESSVNSGSTFYFTLA